ncbi:MAG: hypothetical protein HYW33_02865 [Candidatus Blackburnbacteria bacterium]|nr:hypothetical protein [Candidatus Blackburnbacteria bacterium]
MLTQQDLEQIEELIEEKIVERIRLLPTRDEFFSKMDELITELKAMREEHAVSKGQVIDHEERLESLEEIHPQGKHIPL